MSTNNEQATMSESPKQHSPVVNYWISQLGCSDLTKVVLELKEIANLNHEEANERLASLVQAFTDETIIQRVSSLFSEVCKLMKGSMLLVTMLDATTKTILGKFAASLIISCSLEGTLREASEIIYTCGIYQIKFHMFEPVNTHDKITPCQMALIGMEALDYTKQYDAVIDLLEEINWSVGQTEVNTKLFLLCKILDKLMPVSRYAIDCDNIKYSNSILKNLIKGYHHDKNVLNVNYASFIDLAHLLKKIWMLSLKCNRKECHTQVKKTVKLALHHDIPVYPSLYLEYEAAQNSAPKSNEDPVIDQRVNKTRDNPFNYRPNIFNEVHVDESKHLNNQGSSSDRAASNIPPSRIPNTTEGSDKFNISDLVVSRISKLQNDMNIDKENDSRRIVDLNDGPGSSRLSFHSPASTGYESVQNYKPKLQSCMENQNRNVINQSNSGDSQINNSLVIDYMHSINAAPSQVYSNKCEPNPYYSNKADPSPFHPNMAEPSTFHSNMARPRQLFSNKSEHGPFYPHKSESDQLYTNNTNRSPIPVWQDPKSIYPTEYEDDNVIVYQGTNYQCSQNNFINPWEINPLDKQTNMAVIVPYERQVKFPRRKSFPGRNACYYRENKPSVMDRLI